MNIDLSVGISLGSIFQLRPQFIWVDEICTPVIEFYRHGLESQFVLPGWEFPRTDKPGFDERRAMVVARGVIGLIKGTLENEYERERLGINVFDISPEVIEKIMLNWCADLVYA